MRLTDTELLSQLSDLAQAGRKLERQILEHLIIVEDRELHLKLAFPTMFDFARAHLKASESTTARRMRVVKAARRYPVVLDYLSDGRLHLTALAMVASHLNDENLDRLLSEMVGKSTREVEKALADRCPKPAAGDSIRKLEMPQTAGAQAATVGEKLVLTHESAKPDRLVPKGAGRVRMSFDASEATAAKIDRLRELFRHKFPDARLEDIIDLACEALLDKAAPERRVERREKRAERAAKATPPRASAESKVRGSAVGRRPAVAIADAVKVAAGGCEFVSEDGRRCGSRAWGQIDHVRPYALGGGSDGANLRSYCAAHNRYAGRQSFGDRCRR